jgi:hypothetical protein
LIVGLLSHIHKDKEGQTHQRAPLWFWEYQPSLRQLLDAGMACVFWFPPWSDLPIAAEFSCSGEAGTRRGRSLFQMEWWVVMGPCHAVRGSGRATLRWSALCVKDGYVNFCAILGYRKNWALPESTRCRLHGARMVAVIKAGRARDILL